MRFKLLLSTAVFALLVTACSNDENSTLPGNGEPGSLTITISGEKSPNSRLTGTTTQDDENKVKNFTVYVFDQSSGDLEKYQRFESGTTTGRISGLTTTATKKVVVFVNQINDIVVNNYSEFDKNLVKLVEQTPANGLFMSGEKNDVTLNSENATQIDITVRRLVSKVNFGKLTISPSEGHDFDKFVVKGVSMQKVRDTGAPLSEGLLNGNFNYIGGLALDGSVISENSYLYESYSLPIDYVKGTTATPEKYFYVLPNNGDDGEATLMTIHTSYDGKDLFFPFYINDKQSTGTGNALPDGEFIKRNMVYTINATLRQLGHGTTDPESTNVALDVKISVADWEGELIQDVEW